MFQALSTKKYHCGHQEFLNCSSSAHCSPPNLSCPWPPPPKSEGIIFVRQSINHLKWAAQHSLQSPTSLEARTFPLLEATRDPVVNKVDTAHRSGNNCFNPMSHTVSWFPRNTHPLGVPDWGLYLTWVLSWLKGVWTYTILHSHDLCGHQFHYPHHYL